MTVKRSREDHGEVESMASANCLMLLSEKPKYSSGRVFECKTCNRQFSSFQALGGHRASHKRPKLAAGDFLSPAKPKIHECSVCGLEFAMGQALGGHMRRHGHQKSTEKKCSTGSGSGSGSGKRVMLSLDLNLTPYENHLRFGNLTATV